MSTSDAPLQVGHVALTVNDLGAVGDFYEQVIGLHPIAAEGETRLLGIGDTPLLELRRDAAAKHRPREAGLFHTAFLLPDRQALGSWLRMVAAQQIRLDGASDHLVSEAVYLHDPEGNGIEIYVDRPRNTWNWQGGAVEMDTAPLDLPALLQAGRDGWQAAPDGTVVGHVHLQVGDVAMAEDFYVNTLGLDLTSHMSGASFFSSGGYHHHLAGNIWHSRGAGRRSPDSTGLSEVVLRADADVLGRLNGSEFQDPWGTKLRVLPKV